jgi:beta-phosphoglucomutase family hydrolase
MTDTTRSRIRLPDTITACLFDLDGVLTQTAKVHSEAWKEMFDAYLKERAEKDGEPFREFDIATDYVRYVDGRLRQDGVRSFLESRDIHLPEGEPDDPPEADTINGLGTRKNDMVQTLIREHGVDVYEGSVRFVEALRDAHVPRAVVSASKNTPEVLHVTNLARFFDIRVDGNYAAEHELPGKPAPDTFLAAAKLLGVEPQNCAVIEDATAGVKAGSDGGFGLVVGVDRVGQAQALRDHGADIVVTDLSELLEER